MSFMNAAMNAQQNDEIKKLKQRIAELEDKESKVAAWRAKANAAEKKCKRLDAALEEYEVQWRKYTEFARDSGWFNLAEEMQKRGDEITRKARAGE